VQIDDAVGEVVEDDVAAIHRDGGTHPGFKQFLDLRHDLVVFLVAVLLPIALLSRIPLRPFLRAIKEPALIAFSTASSEAALPRAMQIMEGFGVPRRIVAFVALHALLIGAALALVILN